MFFKRLYKESYSRFNDRKTPHLFIPLLYAVPHCGPFTLTLIVIFFISTTRIKIDRVTSVYLRSGDKNMFLLNE